MHIPIALLIARGYFIYGGIGLIIFGLFDTLDGELARLQERPSAWGMFLDSITDRMKEVLLYVAAAYFFVWSSQPFWAVWAVAACGAGLLVSYVNAWGEVVTKNLASDQAVNKKFRGGIMSFDIRMLVLIIGLLTNYLPAAVVILALLSWQTALTRMLNIRRRLQHAKS
jgi:phosphatidylglycerophosphate synthase